jgi:acetyl-CoA/propionyl-CoA carboxylase biotin carboxyl carrier protein
MNTRLQVEHPVTELVYGLDLVEWQLRVAAGERLAVARPATPAGHAVEARVYAEDPARGFLPTGGTVLALREPAGEGVRVDSGLAEGMTVTSAYDPMLAKVAAWGPDRPTALRRLDAALADTAVLGVTTNIAFLRTLLADPDVQAGHLDTTLAERVADRLAPPAASGHPATASPATGASSASPAPAAQAADAERYDEVLAAAALARLLAREPTSAAVDPWDIPDGWRVGGPAWTKFRFAAGTGTGGPAAEVRVRGLASAGAEVAVGDGDPVPARAEFATAAPSSASLTVAGPTGVDSPGAGPGLPGAARPSTPGGGGTDLLVTYGGRTIRFAYAVDGATVWLGRGGHAWALTEEQAAPVRGGRAAGGDGIVRSPMPGTVLAVHVAPGDTVSAGQAVAVVEAMKMEHTVTAPVAGTVAEVAARAGQQVAMDARLAVIEPKINDDGSVGTP